MGRSENCEIFLYENHKNSGFRNFRAAPVLPAGQAFFTMLLSPQGQIRIGKEGGGAWRQKDFISQKKE